MHIYFVKRAQQTMANLDSRCWEMLDRFNANMDPQYFKMQCESWMSVSVQTFAFNYSNKSKFMCL